MSEIKTLSNGANYTAATVGKVEEFEGKAFFKDAVNATSMEASIGTIAAGEAVPFFHAHKENEEIYVFIAGEGKMQIEGDVIDVNNGSVVRVAPAAMRCIKNTGASVMRFLCFQAKDASLSQYCMTDAVVADYESKL